MESLFSKPTIHWSPLLLVVAGIGQFIYRKYLNPISEQTIDELRSPQRFFGRSFSYRPEAGYVGIIFGIVGFFVESNWSALFP